MTYVLGTAAATNAPLRLKNTIQGDGWNSLAAAYGVTAQQIWAMQPELRGKTLNTPNLEAFIQSRAGWTRATGMQAFDSRDNPAKHGGRAGDGWSLFTSATQIMLPDMPRLDGKDPKSPGTLKPVFPDVKKAGVSPVLVLVGIGALAFLLLGGKKKTKPSPKPVTF